MALQESIEDASHKPIQKFGLQLRIALSADSSLSLQPDLREEELGSPLISSTICK